MYSSAPGGQAVRLEHGRDYLWQPGQDGGGDWLYLARPLEDGAALRIAVP